MSNRYLEFDEISKFSQIRGFTDEIIYNNTVVFTVFFLFVLLFFFFRNRYFRATVCSLFVIGFIGIKQDRISKR